MNIDDIVKMARLLLKQLNSGERTVTSITPEEHATIVAYYCILRFMSA